MFGKLLSDGKINELTNKQKPDFSLSERDIKVAKENFKNKDYDWAFSIAYNAVLQAGRSFMFTKGYKTRGAEQHKTVFEFLEETGLDKELTAYFDSVRKKRNQVIYRDALVISEAEAEETIEKSEEFVQEIRTFVQEIRTGVLNGNR